MDGRKKNRGRPQNGMLDKLMLELYLSLFKGRLKIDEELGVVTCG